MQDHSSSDDELESPLDKVSLRLRGVSAGAWARAAVVIKSEPEPTAVAVQLPQQNMVKTLTSKVWHLRREKNKLEVACAGAVREVKNEVKTKSREVLKNLVKAEQEARASEVALRRNQANTKYYRKNVYNLRFYLRRLRWDRV